MGSVSSNAAASRPPGAEVPRRDVCHEAAVGTPAVAAGDSASRALTDEGAADEAGTENPAGTDGAEDSADAEAPPSRTRKLA
jgi:hypothetical protein